MSVNIHFGRVVKHIREERGLSQEVLADRADLNRSYVGEVERGTAMPSLGTVTKIAKALNLSTSTLLARYEAFEQSQLERVG
jgi:XRE family transcriptional regulator, regulator of sulfur utilization